MARRRYDLTVGLNLVSIIVFLSFIWLMHSDLKKDLEKRIDSVETRLEHVEGRLKRMEEILSNAVGEM